MHPDHWTRLKRWSAGHSQCLRCFQAPALVFLVAGCAAAGAHDRDWQIGQAAAPGLNRADTLEPLPLSGTTDAQPAVDGSTEDLVSSDGQSDRRIPPDGGSLEPYSPDLADIGQSRDDDDSGDRVGAASDGPILVDTAGVLPALFTLLASAEAAASTSHVRILQLGDSHTESDAFTGTLRRALATRFGDGGRGFVAPSVPAWDVEHSSRGPWTITRARPGARNGVVGLGFVRATGGLPASEFTVGACGRCRVGTTASRFDVFYRSHGGSLQYRLDADAWQPAPSGSAAVLSVPVADGNHRLTVRSAGDGAIDVFGIAVERAHAGVVVESAGMIAAQAIHARDLDWSELTREIRERAPDLVLLAFGTNESVSLRRDPAVYERAMETLIERVRAAAPATLIGIVGPPDVMQRAGGQPGGAYQVAPRLLEVVEAARRVARTNRALFIDLLAAMGGAGSMDTWLLETPPLAAPDHVHLTSRGHGRLATAFATDLIRAYEAWRRAPRVR